MRGNFCHLISNAAGRRRYLVGEAGEQETGNKMKWFQHQCDADENKKVRKIEKWGLNQGGEEGAMAATGRYWRLLEKLGKAEEKNGKFEFEPGYDLDLVADDLRCSPEYLMEFCNLLAQINAIDSQLWQEKRAIACPKLAERCDEYCKKKERRRQKMHGQAPESVPTIPGQAPENVPTVSGQTPEIVTLGSEDAPESVPSDSGDPCKNQHIHLHLQEQKNQRIEAEAPSGSAAPPPPDHQITPARVFHMWNDLGCRPSLAELTTERSKRLAVRIRKRGDPAWWERLFLKAKAANKPWLTFDFLIANETNAIKLLEGNYDHDYSSRNNGGRESKSGPGAYQKPNPANPGKFASRSRILSTDPGGGRADPEKDSPGQGGVPGSPECPAV